MVIKRFGRQLIFTSNDDRVDIRKVSKAVNCYKRKIMNDPAASCRISTGYNILLFSCHSGRDPESRKPLLNS